MNDTNDMDDLRSTLSVARQDGRRPADWTSADTRFAIGVEAELPRLRALARRMTRGSAEADDAVQDALERAWRARDQLEHPDAIGAWLRRILARQIIDRARGRPQPVPAEAAELDALLPDVADPVALITAADDELILRAALHRLSDADRAALVLHDCEGWSARDLAALMDRTPDAIHKRIQRGRARLLAELSRGSTPVRDPDESCRAARRGAAALLDGHDDRLADEVRRHIRTCPRCPPALQAASGVLAVLERSGSHDDGPALTTRLSALLRGH